MKLKKKQKVLIMTKQNDNENILSNAYFWLGEEGELEGLTLEEFERKQKEWKGPRPDDFNV